MPKKEVAQKQDVTFADIWKVAYPLDCSKAIKSKNGLSYIPWSNAWHLVMENFPSATFGFQDDIIHGDGSISVVCSVEIEGNVREMWLPITNYKNQVIMNPNGRDVNDSRMRCLVKTLSLFGFGFHVYQGVTQPEDTFDDDDNEVHLAPKTAKQSVVAKPKTPAKTAKPAPAKPNSQAVDSSEDEPDYSADQFDAKGWVDKAIQVAQKFAKTPDGLKSQYKANKAVIDGIQSHHNEEYVRLMAAFSEIRKTLEGEVNGK